ncbi:MAG: hypothetical protein KA285_07070 [Bacteroidia bacterium]|nr:hypothetical protein [Bacteroidia bacterium]
MKIKENAIEIEYEETNYRSLGHCCILVERHWPSHGNFESFQSEEPSIKICVLGVLFMFFNEDNEFFNENYGNEIFNVINENQNIFSEVLHKWFDKGGEGISPKVFIDFEYTITERPINEDEAKKGEDLNFEDGSMIRFKNKKLSWDDIYDQYFVPINNYQEVINDIRKLETLFKK